MSLFIQSLAAFLGSCAGYLCLTLLHFKKGNPSYLEGEAPEMKRRPSMKAFTKPGKKKKPVVNDELKEYLAEIDR